MAAPAWCFNRLANLAKRKVNNCQSQINELQSLQLALARIDAGSFSKYQLLLDTIRSDLQWRANQADDRLVIFTESIKTWSFWPTTWRAISSSNPNSSPPCAATRAMSN